MRSLPSLARLIPAALACASALAGSAWAQVPASSLQMTFVQPTGTVQDTDDIAIVVRLTNIDASGSFIVDNSLADLGLHPSLLPASGNGTDPDTGLDFTAPFATYSSASLSQAYGCSGSFTNGCDAAAYSFNFAANPFTYPFQLAAGQSFEFQLGTFTPVGGTAPAGHYEFYRGVLALWVNGADANGTALSALQFPAQTCNFDSAADCAGVGFFSRDVVSTVPEPQAAVLLALGLLVVGGSKRYRRR